MRIFLIALLAAISYAQTEMLAANSSMGNSTNLIDKDEVYEHRGFDSIGIIITIAIIGLLILCYTRPFHRPKERALEVRKRMAESVEKKKRKQSQEKRSVEVSRLCLDDTKSYSPTMPKSYSPNMISQVHQVRDLSVSEQEDPWDEGDIIYE